MEYTRLQLENVLSSSDPKAELAVLLADGVKDLMGTWATHKEHGEVLVVSDRPHETVGKVAVVGRSKLSSDGRELHMVYPHELAFDFDPDPDPDPDPEIFTDFEEIENRTGSVGTVVHIAKIPTAKFKLAGYQIYYSETVPYWECLATGKFFAGQELTDLGLAWVLE